MKFDSLRGDQAQARIRRSGSAGRDFYDGPQTNPEVSARQPLAGAQEVVAISMRHWTGPWSWAKRRGSDGARAPSSEQMLARAATFPSLGGHPSAVCWHHVGC